MWLVPDGFGGMYGNHDGHWLSWTTRGILRWSEFLDFSPFSPLSGTGSPFLPYLPWLNPGAMALTLPVSLPMKHLASMLVYLVELSASLYLLYRSLEFSRAHSYLATLLYVGIFFIPFWAVTGALPWHTLAPVNAHLIAAMNVATVALIRAGAERLFLKSAFGVVFVAAVLVTFASAPITAMTYLPVYGLLWAALLISDRAPYRIIVSRCGAVLSALLVLGLCGVPRYLAGLAMTSARGDTAPPMFQAGWRLLSPAYWWDLASTTAVCSAHLQLMCPSSYIGWFDMAAFAGGIVLWFTASGLERRYGSVIVAFLLLIHVYAVLSAGQVLGRLHVVSVPYLMWAFFPLAPPAAVALVGAVARRLIGQRATGSAWAPAAASGLIAVAAGAAWFWLILPNQPRLPGRGPIGLPPIAHLPVSTGPIVDYLQRQIGLPPEGAFRGYAATFLGASDGFVRASTRTPPDVMTWNAYVEARRILYEEFGNTFQMMDLWNNGIPTLEEYGQSVSRQMSYVNRDLLAEPQDQMDPLPASILVYRFRPPVLRALGVRFVIADGTLTDPAVELVMTEAGKTGAKVNLYEIKDAYRWPLSPTHVAWARDYTAAVTLLREEADPVRRVVRLGTPESRTELVAASRSELSAVPDGYRVRASAPGTALLVLPLQFSNCWEIDGGNPARAPRIVRVNIVQTGLLFTNELDTRLRFAFEPWRASCRLQDARDLTLLDFK